MGNNKISKENTAGRIVGANMENKEHVTEFTVKQTRAAYGVGVLILVSAAVFLALEIRYHVEAIPLWIYAVLLGMFLLGLYVWVEAWNRRLTVSGDMLYYRNLLGKTVSFSLTDIAYAKAAYHASKGRDYLRLYSQEKKTLCRLECSMKHARRLVWYLHDNGIALELEKGAEGYMGEIIRQEPVTVEEMGERSRQVYAQMETLAGAWLEQNDRLGAELDYGFACYRMENMEDKAGIQPKESRYERETQPVGQSAGQGTGQSAGQGTGQSAGQGTGQSAGQGTGQSAGQGTGQSAEKSIGQSVGQNAEQSAEQSVRQRESGTLPRDFLCRLELYVKKDGSLVQDRRGRLLMLEVYAFYCRESAARSGGYRLYYNGNWKKEMEEDLQWLETYLPGRRFAPLETAPGYALEKML